MRDLDEHVARLLAARAEQGLPPGVEDPVAVATILTVVREARRG